MTPDSILVAGLTADYTAECLDIVRQFDRSNVDPATVARKRDAFTHRMTVMFLQGIVAMEPPSDDAQERTMLQIAMAQVADMPVFHYSGKRHMLWSSGAAADVKTSVAGMATVVPVAEARPQPPASPASEDAAVFWSGWPLRTLTSSDEVPTPSDSEFPDGWR